MSLILTLKDREHRLRLSVLTGIVNCPSISADGELLDRPGYDPRTGILFDPLGVTFPRVPDCPSMRDAEKALKRILRLLKTFDFVGNRDLTVENDDRAVALSLFLTIIARRGLAFAPLHGFDAPVRRQRQVEAGRHRQHPRHRSRGGRRRARQERRGDAQNTFVDVDARRPVDRDRQLRRAA